MPIVQQRAAKRPPVIARALGGDSSLSAALFGVEEVRVLLALALALALVPLPMSLTPKLLVGVVLAVSKLVTLVGK